jgi:hypothetical protein
VKTSFLRKAAVVLVALLGVAGLVQAQEKKVKDQMEYDLFQAAQKETDPQKKIAALTTWKEKYPDSDFKPERLVLMITTYQALQQADRMYATAQELKALEPGNPNALYFLTVLPPTMNVTTADRLAEAEGNAAALAAAIPGIFDGKAELAAQRKQFEQQVTKTNVWAATQRKDTAKVESIYTDLLKKDPADASASYELGRAILASKNAARQSEALYHIGRAAYSTGPNALEANAQKQVQGFFERTVTTFTGSKEDVQMIVDQTKASPFPPAGFKIKSSGEKLAEQEEKMKQEDPQKFLWLTVKKELIGGSGAAYFESSVKGSGLPKLKGKLVSALPANKPKEITVAIMDDSTPEVKLVVDTAFAGAPPVGTVLEFETAVPTAFAADPFLVTADIEQAQITGWPANLIGTAKKATKKAAPVRKKK